MCTDFDDHPGCPYGRLWRFAPAVLGLLDLARPKAKGKKRDELTYTSIKRDTSSPFSWAARAGRPDRSRNLQPCPGTHPATMHQVASGV